MPRDNQRSILYKWEDRVVAHHSPTELTLDECQALVNDASSGFPIKPPEIKAGRSKKQAYGDYQFITLPPWSRRRHIVLHELAHALVGRFSPRATIQGHGPEFVSVYIYLLHHYEGFSYSDLFRSISEYNLKWSDSRLIPRFQHDFKPSQSLVASNKLITY